MLALLLFGGETLKDFAFALLVGDRVRRVLVDLHRLAGARRTGRSASRSTRQRRERIAGEQRRRRAGLRDRDARRRAGRRRARAASAGASAAAPDAPDQPAEVSRRSSRSWCRDIDDERRRSPSRERRRRAAARRARARRRAEGDGADGGDGGRRGATAVPRRDGATAPDAPERTRRRGSEPRRKPQRAKSARTPAREAPLMGMLAWIMMGLAIWHFTIFLPDRYWGGIVGAFLGALFGAVALRARRQRLHDPRPDDTHLLTALEAIPGRADRHRR